MKQYFRESTDFSNVKTYKELIRDMYCSVDISFFHPITPCVDAWMFDTLEGTTDAIED
jgi:hypothetical protein